MTRYLSTLRVWLNAHSDNFIAGSFMAVCSYFAPVQGVLYVALAAVAVDFVTGVIASAVEKGWRSICSKRMYTSLYKVFFITIIIIMFYAIDKEFQILELHRIIAWVVVGFEMFSVLENMAKITNHPIFRILKGFLKEKIKDNTGVELKEDEQNQ